MCFCQNWNGESYSLCLQGEYSGYTCWWLTCWEKSKQKYRCWWQRSETRGETGATLLIKTPALHVSLTMTSTRRICRMQGSVPSREALTFSLSASVTYVCFCRCVTNLTMCHVCADAQKVSGIKSWLMFTPSFHSLCIFTSGKTNNNELKLPEVPFCWIFTVYARFISSGLTGQIYEC